MSNIFLYSFGRFGIGEGQITFPKGITCDKDGNIILCDSYNRRIQVFKGPSEVPTLLSMCWKYVDGFLKNP
jgi:hypothetical protein